MDRINSCGTSSSMMDKQVEKPPPFKLCFSKDRLLGKSNIRVSKINGDLITSKYYSKYENTPENFNAIETHEKSTEQKENNCDYRKGPAILTSYAYGWWYERGLRPIESRLDFRKKTTDLINFGIDTNNAENRKFRNLKQ
ncbi:uncharacterized protein LOC102653888 isoform X1 [Apis mellifera]|uniref:Uncharacterized protein LOC102653888 isoform X1 n=1 Tax=Apis mellifera TaxID=7460 RepID=A0A7M7MVF3_APIME|nr:uncharacterized protein LOC102653888 isoform X1 [Apis mellifera]|eukprot:XP_026301568.1 uncharacterized protein LOC102653888 isoform X1 [Apis mellifera]